MVDIAAAVLLVWQIVSQSSQPVVITYYGTESDGFLGQHHGAYWNGHDCGLPDVVDDIHYGCAAPRWIPYCAELMICHEDVCVIATVVDRQKHDTIRGYAHLDVWPAAAVELDILEAGIVEGRVVVLGHDQD